MCKGIGKLACLAILLLAGLAYSPTARADTCPAGAVSTGLSFILSAFHSDGTTPIVGPVSECETIVLKASLAYTGFDSEGNVVAAFQFGTVTVDGTDATPVGGVPLIGPASCVGSVPIIGSQPKNHVFTPAEVTAGIVTIVASYSGGTAHIGDSDIPNVESAGTAIQVQIAACVATDACDSVACVNGVCVHTPVDCDDGNACTTDSCDAVNGCQNTPIVCNDDDACTTDTCDPAIGCVYTPIVCNDDDACTTDTCDPAIGCVYTPIVCDDGSACTTDTCDPAIGCVYTPIVCNDGSACTTDTCDPAIGCVYTPITCNDNNVCTTDTCDPAIGCVYTGNANCQTGCTPGFFKNCTLSWPGCATPTTTLASVGFTVGGCGCTSQAGVTFIQALGLKGGSSLCAGTETLLRAAAAAYLNSCFGGYPLSTAQVLAEVNAALASCDRAAVIAAASRLDGFNNLGCKDANGVDRRCFRP